MAPVRSPVVEGHWWASHQWHSGGRHGWHSRGTRGLRVPGVNVVMGAVDPSAVRLGFQRSASVPSRVAVRKAARSRQPSAVSFGWLTVRRRWAIGWATPQLAVGRCASGRRRTGGPLGSCQPSAFSRQPPGPIACHLPGSGGKHAIDRPEVGPPPPRGQPRPARTLRRRKMVGIEGSRDQGIEGGVLVGGGGWWRMANSE